MMSPYARSQNAPSSTQDLPALPGATAGVFIGSVDTGRSIAAINNDERFPLMSVFKFPIALAVLKRVEQGSLQLGESIDVSPSQYDPGTWSPALAQHHPQGGKFTLHELLRVMMTVSDNNACDLLLDLVGGPAAVQQNLNDWGLEGISIRVSEREMRADHARYLDNAASPGDIARLLAAFYRGEILNQQMTIYLLDIMAQTQTGAERIVAGLPPNAVFMHKTGSSGTDDRGWTVALNDAGIATIPGKAPLMIAVFIKNASIPVAEAERYMARVGQFAAERAENRPSPQPESASVKKSRPPHAQTHLRPGDSRKRR